LRRGGAEARRWPRLFYGGAEVGGDGDAAEKPMPGRCGAVATNKLAAEISTIKLVIYLEACKCAREWRFVPLFGCGGSILAVGFRRCWSGCRARLHELFGSWSRGKDTWAMSYRVD
jgi:hypothetical protein